MTPFTELDAVAAPLDRANIDTDAIIPKQFLKKIERTGFGVHLFHELRFTDDAGQVENPDFVLNQTPYRNAEILIAQQNFGCGSSREHAPWALLDFGIRCVIAPSFADIFYNNCFKNGILPIVLPQEQVQQLLDITAEKPGVQVQVNLSAQTVTSPSGQVYSFDVDASRKDRLLQGLDDIGWSLQFTPQIEAFETGYRASDPWMFIQS